MGISLSPKLLPVTVLEVGTFYLFAGEQNMVVLGWKQSEDGGSRGIPLTTAEVRPPGYKLRRIDPARCFKIEECQIEIPPLLTLRTGRDELQLGSLAPSPAGASIAILYGDFNDIGWMDMASGEIEANELRYRHFFSGWSLTARLSDGRTTTIFKHE